MIVRELARGMIRKTSSADFAKSCYARVAMADSNSLQTTEATLRQLITETDKAAAKAQAAIANAQAAIAKVAGKAIPETNPAKQNSGASTTALPTTM
jgi:hypothetical protein